MGRSRKNLSTLLADDPVACASYACNHGLLYKPGWRKFWKIAKHEKVLKRQLHQAKLRSYRTAPRYKYGFEVPRDYNHAMELDKKNGNKKWKDSTGIEVELLDDYNAFIDKGPNQEIPPRYKKIQVQFVFDVKHDGRHHA